jgi:hypothetical protein
MDTIIHKSEEQALMVLGDALKLSDNQSVIPVPKVGYESYYDSSIDKRLRGVAYVHAQNIKVYYKS